MLVSKRCSWPNQALVRQNSAWGAGNCCRSQEKVCGAHELMSTKLWHVASLHLVLPSILAKEWKSHSTWRIFDWDWITLSLQWWLGLTVEGWCCGCSLCLTWFLSVLVQNPGGKLKPLKLPPFSPFLLAVEETLGEIIQWNHNLLENCNNHSNVNKGM